VVLGSLGLFVIPEHLKGFFEVVSAHDRRVPPHQGRQTFFLQSVRAPPGTSKEEVLRLCREHCRSDKFVLIDQWKKFPEHFLLGAAMGADADMGGKTTSGYRVYTKNPRAAIVAALKERWAAEKAAAKKA
jgi:hypothetical protein